MGDERGCFPPVGAWVRVWAGLQTQVTWMSLCPCSAQIRWLLDDEIVSALRHSQVISTSILHRVATHIYNSKGRPSCHSEVVLLQFVFGPEHSLEKFKEVKRKP